METIISKSYAEVVSKDEIVSNKRKWYISLHPVINPRNLTKLRIVYEGVAVAGSKSLNDFFNEGIGCDKIFGRCVITISQREGSINC